MKLNVIFVLFALSMTLFALSEGVLAENRIALVIGNGAYSADPLSDPPNDAELIANTLRTIGFEVVNRINVSQKNMKRLIRDFGKRIKAQKAAVGLFYYSGHGMQVGGRNYMIPIDAKIMDESDISIEGVGIDDVLTKMKYAGNASNIIILDACRDNPFEKRFKSAVKGLRRMDAPAGVLVAFAAQANKVALQGEGKYSYFTEALAREIVKPDISARDMLFNVRVAVYKKTDGRQVPVLEDQLLKKVYLSKIISYAPIIDKEKTEFTNSIGMKFVLIPEGKFMMGSKLNSDEVAQKYGGEARHYKRLHPQHEVRISEPFYLQTTEVTVGQWRKFIKETGYKTEAETGGGAAIWDGSRWNTKKGTYWDNPGFSQDDRQPVSCVSWDDVQEFIRWLNRKEGADKHRLPTEAEWEYASRAKSATVFSFGDDAGKLGQYAWYYNNSKGQTHPVGTKKPNAWGLYDMHGNVWEWVEDDWHDWDWVEDDWHDYKDAPKDGKAWIEKPRGYFRVIRGGSWNFRAQECLSATRYIGVPDDLRGIGFRLARSVVLSP